jgi:hypothetical protein
MRSFWYGRSIQNHATGATDATPATAAPNHLHDQSSEEQREHAARGNEHPGAEVRLQQDQSERHRDQHAGGDDGAEAGGSGSRCRNHASIIGRLSLITSDGWK